MADSTTIQAPSTEEPTLTPTAVPPPSVTLKDEGQDEVAAEVYEVSAAGDETHKSDNSEQQQLTDQQQQQQLTGQQQQQQQHTEQQQQQQQQPEHSITATSSKLPPPISFGSFKEESNKAIDLRDSEKKALHDLKNLIQIALGNHEFTFSPPSPPPPPQEQTQTIESDNVPTATSESKATSSKVPTVNEVSIWGVPLLQDERSDAILLKFLRARDFKVKETFTMIKNTLRWRKENNIDSLVNENHDDDTVDDLEKVVFMHGFDREGHPVCYNVYGEFQNKELYQKLFSDEAKRRKFLKQRVMFLERSIMKLDFSPGGICTIFQVNDLKNAPGPGKRELRIATKQALQLLQDNYPEFVAKQVFINVPWWYLAFYTILSPFLTQRTKSKFVFAGPSRSAETLLKYIPPEQLPVQFGGLSVDSCDCNPEFSMDDLAVEVNVKPGTKQIVEIIIYEKCTLVWELRVVGWEVTYGAEFVPNAKDGYTMILQKAAKIGPTDNPVVYNSFKVTELGKVLLTVGNPTSKNKKLLYRYYVKPISEK